MATSITPRTSEEHSDSIAAPEIFKTDEAIIEPLFPQRDFMFSSVIQHEDDLLAFGVTDLENYLNEHISLRDYTHEIPNITFIAIVQWVNDPREKEEISFDKLDNSIYIQKKVFPMENIKRKENDVAWQYNTGKKLIESLKELDYLVPASLLTRLEEVVNNLLEDTTPETT